MMNYLLQMLLFFLCLVLPTTTSSIVAQPLKLPDVAPLPKYSEKDITCLAINIYHEARNQPFIGKLAVAQVTINRVNSSKFPNSICNVVYQAKFTSTGIPQYKQCQFSWYCDGKSDAIRDIRSYESAIKVANEFLYSTPVDVTEGATYYHSYKVRPYWANSFKKVVTIEDHIFYKELSF